MTTLRTRILVATLAVAGIFGGAAAVTIDAPTSDSSEVAGQASASFDDGSGGSSTQGYRWR